MQILCYSKSATKNLENEKGQKGKKSHRKNNTKKYEKKELEIQQGKKLHSQKQILKQI